MLEAVLAFLGEAVFGFLFEVVVSMVIGSAMEFGFQSLRSPFLPSAQARRWLAVPGLVALGLASGALSALLFEHRVVPSLGFEGLSLLVAPLVTGAALELIGRRLVANGLEHTPFTSWWGGASLAFGFAAARLMMLSGA